MEPGKLLEELFDKKTLSILRCLSKNKEQEYYLRELAKAARVPPATTLRILKRLVDLNVVGQRQIKRMKLYRYSGSKEAKFVEQLVEVRRGAVEEFVELSRHIPGIEQLILHGQRQKDRANFLIIGEGVATQPLVEAVAKIKEQYKFSIIYLILGREQYLQMVEMGLYSGDRQVLMQKDLSSTEQ